MRVITATDPATPTKPNEDFVAASHNTVVLLDGAGSPPGAEEGCKHGVSWFARRLGTNLLNAATDHPNKPLTGCLRSAISAVADLHKDTCDLAHPGSPAATVVAIRQQGDTLEYLVLADSTLVLDRPGTDPEVITDDREAKVGRQLRSDMDELPSGSPEHTKQLRRYVEALRDYRNVPDGFWVATSNPDAADRAITATTTTTSVRTALLLSDGASRLADRFGQITWSQLVSLIAHNGPADLIGRTRKAEESDPDGNRWPRGKVYDDATAAVATLCSQ